MKTQTRYQPKDSTPLDLYLEDLVLGSRVVGEVFEGDVNGALDGQNAFPPLAGNAQHGDARAFGQSAGRRR